MKITDKELRKFLNRLYRFLEEPHKIEFKKLRDYRGWVHWKANSTKSTIILDPRNEILSTFIHEFIHYIEPEWTEKEVLIHEELILNKLTQRQVKNILKRLADKI